MPFDPGRFDTHLPVTAPADLKPARRRRRLTMLVIAGVVVLAMLGALLGALALHGGESNAKNYLALLDTRSLRTQFPNDAAALANATRVCGDLKQGGATEGYARDAAAVEVYCPKFLAAFRVVPTPEEQRTAYLAALDQEGLSGRFSSDEQAVAHARDLCGTLEKGGPQQGMPEDRVGVQVYCGKFLEGFKVLRTETIRGTFTLVDSSPSYYYPAIDTLGTLCYGDGGYSDIQPGTAVTVRNGKGELLTQTTLGAGVGSVYRCTMPFSFDVTEGEDSYVVSVSHRGEFTYSFTDLSARGPSLTLGD
jgi:hypothetical protein